jgi:hypothetical protein
VTARFGPRFGAESALIIAAAVFAYLLQVPWPGVAAIVFGAWFVVAVFEVLAARAAPQEAPGADEAGPEIAQEPVRPLSLPVLQPPATAVAAETDVPALPEVPAPPAALPPSGPAPPPAVAPPPPTPPPMVVPPGPPVAAPTPPDAASTPPAAPPAVPSTGDGGWNLWVLERAAREQAGRDPVRDEERSFLLMYLREFADAEGNLPDEFDGLVRDSFGDLVGSGR